MKAEWNTNETEPEFGQEILLVTDLNGKDKYSTGVYYVNETETGIYPQVLHTSSTPTSWKYVKYWTLTIKSLKN
jgi:hypothetical protein